MPIHISHNKEVLNYYCINVILTSVVTRYDVIFANQMIRNITVLKFLFNHFFTDGIFCHHSTKMIHSGPSVETSAFAKTQGVSNVRKKYSYWTTWQNRNIYRLSCI